MSGAAASKLTSLERFKASMLLSGVGDAMGYKDGHWEFCFVGEEIHKELKKLGGVKKLKISLPGWPVSDDTVMHIATAKALVLKSVTEKPTEDLYLTIAREYKECMSDMNGRSPGDTSSAFSSMLNPDIPKGYVIPFNPRGGGCGAAMRAMCIGLRYHRPEDIDDLIAVSVESGRMTHNHPTGYLGAFTSALFTSFAFQGKPLGAWGKSLIDLLPKVLDYIKAVGRDVQENIESWHFFTNKWMTYLDLRGITDGKSMPVFPEPFGVKERDGFAKSVSFSGWGGASGHDAPMIAYDGLLKAGNNWEELCKRAMLHGGDCDSTGVIAGSCFGAMYGFTGVPECNYKDLEKKNIILDLAEKLHKICFPKQ